MFDNKLYLFNEVWHIYKCSIANQAVSPHENKHIYSLQQYTLHDSMYKEWGDDGDDVMPIGAMTKNMVRLYDIESYTV